MEARGRLSLVKLRGHFVGNLHFCQKNVTMISFYGDAIWFIEYDHNCIGLNFSNRCGLVLSYNILLQIFTNECCKDLVPLPVNFIIYATQIMHTIFKKSFISYLKLVTGRRKNTLKPRRLLLNEALQRLFLSLY